MSDGQDEQEWNLSDEDWAKKPRVFAAPVLAYRHDADARDGEGAGTVPRAGVLVNRKRFMPRKLMRWEGQIGLFGGAVARGESMHRAIDRELGEELPDVRQFIGLPQAAARLGSHAAWVFGGTYLRRGAGEWGRFTEDDFRLIAGACREGAADVLFAPEIEALSPEAFTYPELRAYLLGLLAGAQAEIDAQWSAE